MALPTSLADSGGVIAAIVIILLVVVAVVGELSEYSAVAICHGMFQSQLFAPCSYKVL